jgi:hypothetical protein
MLAACFVFSELLTIHQFLQLSTKTLETDARMHGEVNRKELAGSRKDAMKRLGAEEGTRRNDPRLNCDNHAQNIFFE